MVSLKRFPAPTAKVSLPGGETALKKAVEKARDGAHGGRTPLHLCKSEIKVWNERHIYKDQHSLCQILIPDLS